MKKFAFRSAALGAAAVAVALCASAAQATTVHDKEGDLLGTFSKAANTSDDFRDLDVRSATVTYDAKFVYLSATMYGDIGSTDGGFYAWGINTGTGVPLFNILRDKNGEKDLGPIADNILFDTFVLIKPNDTGSINYVSGDNPDGVESVTHHGATINAVIARSFLDDDATLDISQWSFNIWPRINDLHNASISDFAPNDHNFNGSASVPEPAAWALMIAGFGLAGSTLRRRRSSPLAA